MFGICNVCNDNFLSRYHYTLPITQVGLTSTWERTFSKWQLFLHHAIISLGTIKFFFHSDVILFYWSNSSALDGTSQVPLEHMGQESLLLDASIQCLIEWLNGSIICTVLKNLPLVHLLFSDNKVSLVSSTISNNGLGYCVRCKV